MESSRERLEMVLDFWRACHRLSSAGHCDSIVGAESRRVFGEWIDAGRPAEIDTFIIERANTPPR